MPKMTHEDLLTMARKTMDDCLETMKRKNADYSGGGGPFANFEAGEHVLGIPAPLGIMQRCLDKFQRIRSFVIKGELQVKEESVEDAIDDVINYMVLMKGIIRDQKNAEL